MSVIRGLVSGAVPRLLEDDHFSAFWDRLGPMEQDEVVAETVRRLDLFRGSFPPLRELRRELAPMSELFLQLVALDGMLVVSGRVDLVLGRLGPTRATRVLIDLKTGRAWPDHPEDMRLYALLHTFRFGVPPRRVATLFLGAGDWQAEEVSERVLEHACDRIVAAVRSAVELATREPRDLRPGPWCGWCPRAVTCPVASLARD